MVALADLGLADEQTAWSELKDLPMLPSVQAVRSPNGRLLLRASFNDPRHTLVLDEPARERRLNLMRIERNVQIGWRADSALFFVNDNFGSNASDCEVYRPFDPHVLVSIARASSQSPEMRAASERDTRVSHLYFNCIRWLSDDRVFGIIYGHYDDKSVRPFEDHHFIYDLRTGKLQRTD